ncbi:MAG: hypothetical protein AAGH92_11585 [Planctomycetota bacterium]
MPYQEPIEVAQPYRDAFRRQCQELVRARFADAAKCRTAYFQPDSTSPASWSNSLEKYRSDLRELLGWPLNAEMGSALPSIRRESVGEDEFGRIERVWVEALPDWSIYSLLMIPRTNAPTPLALVQHGALGTPEWMSGFYDIEQNYGDLPRRLLRRGIAVAMPQLWVWDTQFDAQEAREAKLPAEDPAGVSFHEFAGMLCATGSNAMGLEAFGLMRTLDALLVEDRFDAQRVGMAGLSYGGSITLITAALDVRIRSAWTSCCFHNGASFKRSRSQGWRDILHRFGHAELAGMVCPRPLCVEIGKHDELIPYRGGVAESEKVRAIYDRLSLSDQLLVHVHDGGHEIDESDDRAVNFFVRTLNGAEP